MSDESGESAKNTSKVVKRPIHRSRFGGSPRKLKGRTFGRWVKRGHREIYIPGK